MPAEEVNDLRKQLGNRIRGLRIAADQSQQEFATSAGVGVNTVIRMERGEISERRGSAWGKIEAAVGWPTGYFEDFLAGRIDAELEARYRREPISEGDMVQAFEDALYEALVVAAPDTPLSQIDKARKAAFKVLRDNGIEVARRHLNDQSGTDDDA